MGIVFYSHGNQIPWEYFLLFPWESNPLGIFFIPMGIKSLGNIFSHGNLRRTKEEKRRNRKDKRRRRKMQKEEEKRKRKEKKRKEEEEREKGEERR